MSAEAIKKRAGKLFGRRDDLNSLFQEIALNCYPERATFTSSRAWGEEFSSHLFDSSPVTFRRDLGNAISSYLRPREQEWYKATLADKDLAKWGAVAQWLESATEISRKRLYSRAAQFVRATKAGDHDFVTFGQAVLSSDVNRANDGLLFRDWHLKDCVWVENEEGVVDGLWRKISMTARQMAQRFGKNKLADEIIQTLETDPDKEFEVMHCMVPSDEYESDTKKLKNFPYVSVYIDMSHQQDAPLSVEGSHEFRYIVPRWLPIPDSPYGISPAAMTALPDSRMIQSMARVIIEAGEKSVDPPMKAMEDAIRGEVNLYAQGITWVDREYNEKLGPAIEPMFLGKDVGIGFELLDRTKAQLSDAWYISKLSLPQQNEKTAYETSKLYEEFIRQATPLFEPMEMEYNVPILEMAFTQLHRLGMFPPLPDELKDQEIEFEFSNPLQDAIEKGKVYKFQSTIELTTLAAGLDETAPSILNIPVALKDAVTGGGAPADWLADEKAAQEDAQVVSMMRTAMSGAQIAKPAAEAMSKFADAGAKADAA